MADKAEKAKNFMRSGQESFKAGNIVDALSDFEVSLNFTKTSIAYLSICSCYMRLGQYDKLYETVQAAQSLFPDDKKFLVPLQKYYQFQGMNDENLYLLEEICIDSFKEGGAKQQKSMLDFVQNMSQMLDSQKFIESTDSQKANKPRDRLSKLFLECLARKCLNDEALLQILLLQAKLIILSETVSDLEKALFQLTDIVKMCPTTLKGPAIEEWIQLLAGEVIHRCTPSMKSILVYKVFSHFTSSVLSLFYQIKYIQTNSYFVMSKISAFIERTYQTLCYLFHNHMIRDDFNKELETEIAQFTSQNQRIDNLPEGYTVRLTAETRGYLLNQFKIRSEIFLLFSRKMISSAAINKSTEDCIEMLESNLQNYLDGYDAAMQQQENAEEISDESPFTQNALFEIILLMNHGVCKARGKKPLLQNLKETLNWLDQQKESILFLREIYNRIALKIIDAQDELVMNKNNVSIQTINHPEDTSGFKTLYLYHLKLNKNFHVYDSSTNLQTIILRVLEAEPANIFFKAELIWLQFSVAQNKHDFFKSNLDQLEELLEYSLLTNDKDESALLLKRVSILRMLFDPVNSQSRIIQDLQKAKQLNPLDSQVYVCLGIALHAHGQLEEALKELQTAFIYFQHDIHVNKMIFFLMTQLKQNSEAITFLHRIYPAFKQIFWINRVLGVHSSNFGDYKSATLFCQRALELYHFEQTKTYKLFHEKKSHLSSEVPFDLPHMMDYSGFVYYDDYLIWSDSVYENSNATNLSSSLIQNPQCRVHVKLSISLAQADVMQGKTCSSFASIQEGEKAYLAAQSYSSSRSSSRSDAFDPQQLADDIANPARLSHCSDAQEVLKTLGIFTNVFQISVNADKIISAYDFSASLECLLDALTVNFEYAQIASYLNNNLVCYERIRTFLILCYRTLAAHSSESELASYKMIKRFYGQMVGLIIEISLKYAQSHWRKYTQSSARSLVDRIKMIQPPSKTNSTLLVEIAFAEFYTFSGFISNDSTELKKALTHIEQVFSRVGVDYQAAIFSTSGQSPVTLQEKYDSIKNESILKYAMKALSIVHFYLFQFDPENNQAYEQAIACATAGILTYNIDVDFYNHYGLVQKDEMKKIGAFIKSNRIEKNSMALDCLAFIYLKKQRYEEATNMLLKSIEINTTNSTAYIGLFIIQYNMGLAFDTIVQTGNDDAKKTYFNMSQQMIQRCGSYLHYVKQIEISASSVLFDGLLEFMKFQSNKQHTTYYFSTDLFDRAPYLSETMLGTIYRIMMVKQQSTFEKKKEVFAILKNQISTDNLHKLLLQKAESLNVKFMEIVEERALQDIESIKSNQSPDKYLDSLVRIIKMYLALALYIHEEQRGMLFFKKVINKVNSEIAIASDLCSHISKTDNLKERMVVIAQLEYQIAKKIDSTDDIETALRRLANLKKTESCEDWPFSSEFTQKINHLAEYKFLQGVHFYALKQYAIAKRYFFSAVLIDPLYKAYASNYISYLVTQERHSLYNPYQQVTNPMIQFEQQLLITLNSQNLTLKQKIQTTTKAAVYLNKPYLYYLLVHFSFEDTVNHNFKRILQLMTLLRTKVISPDLENKEGLFFKAMKLYVELFIFISKLSKTTVINDNSKQELELVGKFIATQCSLHEKLSAYKNVLNIYYKDTAGNSNEIAQETRAVFEKDRVVGYFLGFNLIRKLMRNNQTNGLLELIGSLQQNIYQAVEEGVLSQKIQKSNKGKLLMNMVQHLDGFTYLLSLQEEYRNDSLYSKQDIQEMIHNSAAQCYDSHKYNISMKLIQAQQLYRQRNTKELAKLLKTVRSQVIISQSELFLTTLYEVLLYFSMSQSNPSDDNVSNFFERTTELEENYSLHLTSTLLSLVHYMQGIIYLKIATKKPELDRKTILREFKLAILFSPEYSSTLMKFLQE